MPKFDKAKVVTQLQSKSKLDLSHDHVTTSNFMDLQPVCYRHMIPQEKLNVQASAFARLAPLTVPTYGRARLNMRAFFVPFRTVMPKFNEFIVDTVSTKFGTGNASNTALVDSTPIITNATLWTVLSKTAPFGSDPNNIEILYAQVVSSSDAYDFLGSDNTYYRLTYQGRQLYKLLRSLGYEVAPSDKYSTRYSALALLCYLRVYFDWYTVSQYLDTASYQLFASWFTYDNPQIPLEIDANMLDRMFSFIYRVCYEGDYFTSAWDNPVAPNSGLFSSFIFPDITGSSGAAVSNGLDSLDVGTPNAQLGEGAMQITQYTIDTLQALTDYMKRHQLSGARAIDRYLADYGIALPEDKFQRSTYLGMSSIDIKIGDVMSHSDTSTSDVSNLGDYAGQGYLSGGKSWTYTASEFGMFIVVSSLLPSGGIVQGYDRNNLHTTKDQFFNGDFDSLGVQVLNKGEVYVSRNATFALAADDYEQDFGYTPRYAEYKVGRDQLTGDISLPSVLADGDSWHLFRVFDDSRFSSSVDNLRHSLGFCLGSDASQYSRIFNSEDYRIDKFYMYYHFNIVAYAPCKSLFDTYEFDSDGKDIVMDANGVKMN